MSCGIPATIRATSWNSRRNPRHPAEAGASIGPGTTKQSRPCSSAHEPVMSAPLLAGASTTIVASARPLMIRLRRGNVPLVGATSGASSDAIAPPPRRIAWASRSWPRGIATVWPPPITATVDPPARTVASCAAPSMP